MICAGVLPVVHDSGGVRELVTDPGLRFSDMTDLLQKVMAVMRCEDAACAQRSAVLKMTFSVVKVFIISTMEVNILVSFKMGKNMEKAISFGRMETSILGSLKPVF